MLRVLQLHLLQKSWTWSAGKRTEHCLRVTSCRSTDPVHWLFDSQVHTAHCFRGKPADAGPPRAAMHCTEP